MFHKTLHELNKVLACITQSKLKSLFTQEKILKVFFFQSNSKTRLRNANTRGQLCMKFWIILLAHICLQKVFTWRNKKGKKSVFRWEETQSIWQLPKRINLTWNFVEAKQIMQKRIIKFSRSIHLFFKMES